jgi:hypothetical protein
MRFIGGAVLVSLFAIWSPASAQESLLDEWNKKITFSPEIMKLEGEGLHLRSPSRPWWDAFPRTASSPSNVAPFALTGNFEYSAEFRVEMLGLPGAPIRSESNAELSVLFPGAFNLMGINVGVRANEKDCFNVVRISQNHAGTHYNIMTFPRKSKTGKIRMRREGNAIIFNVVDGYDAREVELVRYPMDNAAPARPRLSIFQDRGISQPPIDVVFDPLTLRGEKVVREVDAFNTPPQVPRRENYPIQIDYSKNVAGVFQDFLYGDDKPNDNRAFKVEGSAIRVQPPVSPVYRKSDQGHYFLQSRYGLGGDFEISYRFAPEQYGPIGPDGYGSVALGMSLETESPIGSVGFSLGTDRGGVPRATCTRYSPSAKGGNWDTMVFPFPAPPGFPGLNKTLKPAQLTIRRTGSYLYYFRQIEGETAPVLLATVPFIPDPIKRVRIMVDMGGNASNAINGLMSDLSIKTEILNDPRRPKETPIAVKENETSKEPVVLESAPLPPVPERGGSSKMIFIVAGILLALGLVVVIVRKRKPAPAPAAPSKAAAAPKAVAPPKPAPKPAAPKPLPKPGEPKQN